MTIMRTHMFISSCQAIFIRFVLQAVLLVLRPFSQMRLCGYMNRPRQRNEDCSDTTYTCHITPLVYIYLFFVTVSPAMNNYP